jgi:clan AA aspartic protease
MSTHADIDLENLRTQRVLALKAVVDAGAVFLSVPEHVAAQLGFDMSEAGIRERVLVNGHHQVVPVIGPLRVRFGGRYCDLSALVFGDEPLVGTVPMAMMDLIVDPATQTLSVNPASPDVPVTIAK